MNPTQKQIAISKPQIIFEPTVFAREAVLENWPHLHKVITSGDQLAAAFEEVKQNPVWREDPRLRDIEPETADEVLDLYNEVIADGRYVADFLSKPREVAQRLGRRPSKKAINVISAAGKGKKDDGGEAASGAALVVGIAVVGIAVTTAIVSSHADRRDRILVDESGRVKLGSARAKKKKSKNRQKHG